MRSPPDMGDKQSRKGQTLKPLPISPTPCPTARLWALCLAPGSHLKRVIIAQQGVGNFGLASSRKLEAGRDPGTGLASLAFICELGCCVLVGLRRHPAQWPEGASGVPCKPVLSLTDGSPPRLDPCTPNSWPRLPVIMGGRESVVCGSPSRYPKGMLMKLFGVRNRGPVGGWGGAGGSKDQRGGVTMGGVEPELQSVTLQVPTMPGKQRVLAGMELVKLGFLALSAILGCGGSASVCHFVRQREGTSKSHAQSCPGPLCLHPSFPGN